MINKILDIITGSVEADKIKDEDWSDRLSNRYSTILLVAFAITVVLRLNIGAPITCFTPQHMTDNQDKYANNYCWVTNTYYLPINVSVEIPKEEEPKKHLPYYQWVPFILLFQAVMFYAPSVLWNGLNQQAGIDADSILHASVKLSSIDPAQLKPYTNALAERITIFLGNKYNKLRSPIWKLSSIKDSVKKKPDDGNEMEVTKR